MAKRRKLRESGAKYATQRGTISVEFDPAQLAREGVVLKRNGKPIAVAISLEEHREYNAWKKQRKPAADFPPAWHAEKAAFQKLLPELLKTYREKWVAIYQGKVVDSDEKEGELMYRVALKYGDAPVYIDEVLGKPRVYRVTSAWYKIN